MPVRVELSDPSSDADELEGVLFAAGFQVLRVALEELGTRGAASVVDLGQAGGVEALGRLREAGLPAIGVGAADTGAEVPRPVRHDALLMALRRALDHHAAGQTPVTATQEVHATQDAALGRASTGAGLEDIGRATFAMPSDALSAELRQACGAELIDAYIGGQGDDAMALAPDVLFEHVPMAGELIDHGHDLTPLELSLPQLEDDDGGHDDAAFAALPAAEPRSLEPGQGWLRLADPVLGQPDLTYASRTGMVTPLGMIRLLWRVVELGLDVELDARRPTSRVVLRFLAGGLRELWGQTRERAARALGVLSGAATEEEARAALEEAIAEGRLSRFAADRAVRLADEAQVVELALADSVQFTLRPLGASDWERLGKASGPLGGTVLARVAAGAREALRSEALDRLAAGLPVLRLLPDAGSRLEQAEVEPELRALILRHDGAPHAQLLREAGPDVGAAGLLCVLAVLESARFVRIGTDPP